MLHNLSEKSAKIDVFMRMFESLLNTACAIAIYRENGLIKFSRCRGKLYDTLDNYKPFDHKDSSVTLGSSYVLDDQFKPSKAAKECSDKELKGKIMVVPFKQFKVAQGIESSHSSPASPRRKNINRGAFLFVDLSVVNSVARLLMNPDLLEAEYLALPTFFLKMEKDLLAKIESK